MVEGAAGRLTGPSEVNSRANGGPVSGGKFRVRTAQFGWDAAGPLLVEKLK